MGEDIIRTADQGELASAIARHIVAVTAEFAGRGPTKTRASLDDNVVTVVLSDSFTRGERSLVEAGQGATVLEMRRSFQRAMRGAYIDGVETITGRAVIAFLSDHSLDPDVAVEVFILAR